MNSIIAHFQEIALKGKNRPWFLHRLVRNLHTALEGLDVEEIRTPMGRIEMVFRGEVPRDEVYARLSRVFGLANFSIAGRTTLDLDRLGDQILRDLPAGDVASFRIKVRRADKRYPIPSPQVERELGRRVIEARGWKVDLSDPAFVIGVELLATEAFYHFDKQPGPGGLPTGTSGRVAVLLSGGIDSPVAAWRMLKRGCSATLIHFHSYPFLEMTSQEKARQLAEVLTRYQLQSRLYLVPFGELQRQVTLSVPGPMRVVVYRRLMLRIAERIARKVRAHALVTGDSMGQVASQTLDNMAVIQAATSMLVFRPLIGMDKEEITAEAERIGSYPISIIPDQDCCTLFTPRHPLTNARLADIEQAEQSLPIDEMVAAAVAAAQVEWFRYPMVKSKVGLRPRTSDFGSNPKPEARSLTPEARRQRPMMTFTSLSQLTDALAPVATVHADRVAVTGSPSPELIDGLAHTAAFGADDETKGTARWVLRYLGAAAGIRFASIHDLYMAMGRGEAGGFTVPAINVRAMAYDTGRAVMRAAKTLDVGALILEIARSEIGYTEQRPHEYAAVMMAAALREGFQGHLFLQGDHVQVNAKKWAGPDRDKEIETLKALIKEEIAAGFYNIDIDTSTLVDLDQPTLDAQQAVNCELAADFTAFIRQHEPDDVTVSVGGEIGEVGGKNSDVHELHAFMKGYNARLAAKGKDLVGISKISVQTGTAHGGFVGPDGQVRKDVKLDLVALKELSTVARTHYGLAGAVQHGASTLPADAFDAFPEAGACEIHLATNFQNMVYDHAAFPAALKDEMYAWIREHAQEERKPKDTEEQFIYKARKKAIGPFKRRLWELPEDVRRQIGASLEEQFAFLMKKLRVTGTSAVAKTHVTPHKGLPTREAEILAAGGVITAAERKAEGLAD
ncbi:MAG: tRNA uracil 4-sulfurtransferase ThiI [Acidobacteriota bacterium]